jgi:hypothetical protein
VWPTYTEFETKKKKEKSVLENGAANPTAATTAANTMKNLRVIAT